MTEHEEFIQRMLDDDNLDMLVNHTLYDDKTWLSINKHYTAYELNLDEKGNILKTPVILTKQYFYHGIDNEGMLLVEITLYSLCITAAIIMTILASLGVVSDNYMYLWLSIVIVPFVLWIFNYLQWLLKIKSTTDLQDKQLEQHNKEVWEQYRALCEEYKREEQLNRDIIKIQDILRQYINEILNILIL